MQICLVQHERQVLNFESHARYYILHFQQPMEYNQLLVRKIKLWVANGASC